VKCEDVARTKAFGQPDAEGFGGLDAAGNGRQQVGKAGRIGGRHRAWREWAVILAEQHRRGPSSERTFGENPRLSPTTPSVMANADPTDPNYDPHLSAVDTRTANRLMALDPEERQVDALGVPLVHIGFTGTTSTDVGDMDPETADRASTMHERREAVEKKPMKNVMDYRPGEENLKM
jgi:hypothetical protein